MEFHLRLAVGLMADVASLLLYVAPILTFVKVVKKKSSDGYSCVPYILALFNSSLYTWYGLPIVSLGWENFLLVAINSIGILFEISFISIFFNYATSAGRKKVAILIVPVLITICSMTMISTFALHDHRHRKVFVGSIGLVASVSMYGSPLIVMKQVIQTKSVKFMPFSLSLFSFLSSSFWMVYGFLSHDIFLASPNCIGSPLGILQLMLYCNYMKRGTMKEPQKWDMESANVNKRENLHQEHKVVESIDEMKHIQHLKVVIAEEKIHDGKI
ncbi:hypothetical protein LIER_10778 [Lithospermum erythrorhizon]|uniref:Bidirectional sugar transporter SWEET n=1 Tax=Lithospermum erythrorhizon TaxID=34254 RepID=A0AAV3PKH1_LITER